jgi:hypothetical protein
MTQLKDAINRLLPYIQTSHVQVLEKSGTHLGDIQQQAGEIGKNLSGHGEINMPGTPTGSHLRDLSFSDHWTGYARLDMKARKILHVFN